MYFINSDADSGMPTHQMWDMFNAFYQNGYPTNMYRMWTIPGSSAHGFAFWNDPIQDINPNTDTWHVKDRVVGYFEYFLLQGNTHF